MNLINLRAMGNNTAKFIRSPITEIIFAFFLEMSRNYIFAFIHQFTGDQLVYTISQYLIVFLPWIMLGHGMFRYESQKIDNVYSNLNNYNSDNTLKPRKNLNLLSFLLATFIIIELLL